MKTDLFDSPGYLLKRAQQALRNAMDNELRVLNLTSSQYATLAALELEAGLSNADLARRCFVAPQTMHQILIGLEKAKLLERTPHPEHGRIQTTLLTSKARTLLAQAHKKVLTIETKMLGGLSTKERNEVRQKLIRFSKNLESE
jgi:DNA-binding MarR family transcriptional regulator